MNAKKARDDLVDVPFGCVLWACWGFDVVPKLLLPELRETARSLALMRRWTRANGLTRAGVSQIAESGGMSASTLDKHLVMLHQSGWLDRERRPRSNAVWSLTSKANKAYQTPPIAWLPTGDLAASLPTQAWSVVATVSVLLTYYRIAVLSTDDAELDGEAGKRSKAIIARDTGLSPKRVSEAIDRLVTQHWLVLEYFDTKQQKGAFVDAEALVRVPRSAVDQEAIIWWDRPNPNRRVIGG